MDASEADAMPLPREDTTPPVTKIRGVMERPLPESGILHAEAGGGRRQAQGKAKPTEIHPRIPPHVFLLLLGSCDDFDRSHPSRRAARADARARHRLLHRADRRPAP